MSYVRDVSSLPISEAIISRLHKCGFRSTNDLQGLRPSELAKEADIAIEEALLVVKNIVEPTGDDEIYGAERILKTEGKSAKAILVTESSSKPIITFCKALDTVLGGGICCGQISEICGPPGVCSIQIFLLFTL